MVFHIVINRFACPLWSLHFLGYVSGVCCFQKVMVWLYSMVISFVFVSFQLFSNLVSFWTSKFTYLHMCVCCNFVFDDLFRFPVLVYKLDIIDIFDSERIIFHEMMINFCLHFGYSASWMPLILVNLDYKRYLNIFQFDFVFVHMSAP